MTGAGTIYVLFPEPAAPPKVVVDAGSGAYGVDPWTGAAADREWRAEQAAFLDLASAADTEAIDQDQ